MKDNIYFFQPQNLTGHEGMIQAWLPYSVACMWAYVSQFKTVTDRFHLARVYATKEPVNEVIDQLQDPKIVGFSTFVWNQNYNLAVAKAIKERWPDCQIIFGGPQVTYDYMKKYDFIDSMIESEGERLFKDFLDDYINGSIEKIYSKARIKDLTELPSAYSTGIFEDLISQYPELTWATTLETNRGCPYHCTFCDWGSVTNSKIFKVALEKLQYEVDWIKQSRVVTMVNLADANFGILKGRDLEIAKMLRTMVDDGPVGFIDISYTKSYNTFLYDIVRILDQPTGFTVSFQSNNKDTLDAIKRKNLNEKDLMKLLSYAEDHHVTHEQEYILGLPLETKDSWYEGMTNLLQHGQHKVFDVFLCSLLPNTELASPESRAKYGIQSTYTPELNSVGPRNRENITEYSEIINQTNTLPQKDLISCFIFSIIIMHTHCTGYTFITSRLAEKVYDISYKDFYQELEKLLYQDPTFGEHLNYIRSLLTEIFATGMIKDPNFKQEGRFDYLSYRFFYKNKDRLYQLGAEAVENLYGLQVKDDLIKVQSNYIFDMSKSDDFKFESIYNIDDFSLKKTTYSVESKIDKIEFVKLWKLGSGDFHRIHQKKKLVNNITNTAKTIKLKLVTAA